MFWVQVIGSGFNVAFALFLSHVLGSHKRDIAKRYILAPIMFAGALLMAYKIYLTF